MTRTRVWVRRRLQVQAPLWCVSLREHAQDRFPPGRGGSSSSRASNLIIYAAKYLLARLPSYMTTYLLIHTEICSVSLFEVVECIDRIWRLSSWSAVSILCRTRTRRRTCRRTVCRGMATQVGLRATYQSPPSEVYVQALRLISFDQTDANKKIDSWYYHY